MKKHILVAAVATAFAVPAMAQQVTVSGLIDVAAQTQAKASVGANTLKTSGTTGVSGWSTSNIAFNVSEDLGGGLKASAVISSFFDSTSTSPSNTAAASTATSYNTIGGRDRFIRLDGGFGAVQFGRFTPTLNGLCTYACAGGTNNNAGTIDSTGSDLVQGTLGGRSQLSAASAMALRAHNAFSGNGAGAPAADAVTAAHMEHQSGVIEYTTPTFNGFNGVLTYIQGKADDSRAAGMDKIDQNGVRFNYSAGPLSASFATGTRKAEVENDAATKSKADWLGASYNLGVVQLFASHAKRKDNFTDILAGAAAVTLSNVKVNTFGVAVPLGSVTLNASMYEGEDSEGAGAADDRELKGHQVAARYTLSKRTFIYAVSGVNKDSRKDASQANDDFKRTQTQFGVVHSF